MTKPADSDTDRTRARYYHDGDQSSQSGYGNQGGFPDQTGYADAVGHDGRPAQPDRSQPDRWQPGVDDAPGGPAAASPRPQPPDRTDD